MGERTLVRRKCHGGVHDAFMQRDCAQLRAGPARIGDVIGHLLHRGAIRGLQLRRRSDRAAVLRKHANIGAAGAIRPRPAFFRPHAVVAQHGNAQTIAVVPGGAARLLQIPTRRSDQSPGGPVRRTGTAS